MFSANFKIKAYNLAWDTWCCLSVVGIWPRYIEPNLLFTTRSTIALPDLPKDLEGFKILQFSDLHYSSSSSFRFLNQLSKKINREKPDLIVFTGDWVVRSKLERPQPLIDFCISLHAPFGAYAILGNHDYEQYVSRSNDGKCHVVTEQQPPIKKAFKTLFGSKSKPSAHSIPPLFPHPHLADCLKQTPFQLLHNETRLIRIKDTYLNLCGLGDLWLDQCHPQSAFANYDTQFPGIILTHNPDSFVQLQNYPGELLLAGHTHGCQVNLPWLWKRFCGVEHLDYCRGLVSVGDKLGYVSRGISSQQPFRWCSPPEIHLITLMRKT